MEGLGTIKIVLLALSFSCVGAGRGYINEGEFRALEYDVQNLKTLVRKLHLDVSAHEAEIKNEQDELATVKADLVAQHAKIESA